VPDPARKRRSKGSPQKSPTPKQPNADNDNKESKEADNENEEDEEEEQTFDPRSPRSNFSLYPPEQLLYCEDCHQIKCPRCITEEIVSWYCPNCLFETPSSMVRSDGNRYAPRTSVPPYKNRNANVLDPAVAGTASIARLARLLWL
jgi:dynactin-4